MNEYYIEELILSNQYENDNNLPDDEIINDYFYNLELLNSESI